MTRTILPVVLTLAVGWQPLVAQEQEDTVPESEPDSVSILRALRLPDIAEILRQRGVPTEEVETAIENAQQRDVAPAEMAGVMEETAETVDETGPIEGFGAFVQEQLEAGLRGRELAEAIRAEHARRGIGPGNRLDQRGGPPEDRGPGMRPERGGPPDSVRGGPPGERGGPPDSVRGGPPGQRGGPPDSARGGPPGERGGPPDSVRRRPPDSLGGNPPGRHGGGRSDTTPGGSESGSSDGQSNGGQR